MAAKLYGVSSGNGNDGVSHMFADYYVRTDDPWTLAQAALLAEFKPGKGQAFALDQGNIDGEADYTITATIDAPPCEETEDGSYPTLYVCGDCGADLGDIGTQPCGACGADNAEEKEFEDCEDGRNWSDNNGSWLIVEIFPEDEPREGRPTYETLEEAFDAATLALARGA